MGVEVSSWPYGFVGSGDFPTADQRGRVTGQLLVRDRFVPHFHAPCLVFLDSKL